MSETVLIRYKADTEEVKKELKAIDNEYGNIEDSSKKATDTANKGMKQVSDGTKGLQSDFRKLATTIGAAFAIQQVISFGLELNKLSIQIETTGKRMEVVFGDARKVVEREAKKMAESLGLSVNQFELMATKAGDILVPLGVSRKEAAKMSTEIVKLAGALSEFSAGTVDTEQAVHAVTSALTGEREMLKTLGVVLKEEDINTRLLQKGQANLEGQALSTAKAVATLELVSEKSADAQTFFAENSDSAARKSAELQARIQTLREELAQKLQPVFLQITKFAIGFIKSLDVDRIGRIAKQVIVLGTAFKTFTLITKALTGPIGIVTAGLGALGAAIGVARIGATELEPVLSRHEQLMDTIGKRNKDAADAINEETAELQALFKQLRETNPQSEERASLMQTINNRYGTTLKNLSDETAFIQQLDVAYKDLVESIKERIKLDAARETLTELLKEQIALEQSLAVAQTQRTMALNDLNREITDNGDLSAEQIRTINSEIAKGADNDIPKYTQQLANVNQQIESIKTAFTDAQLFEDTGGGGNFLSPKKTENDTKKVKETYKRTGEDILKDIERNLTRETTLRKAEATRTIEDDLALKDELLQIEIEHLQRILFFRRLAGAESADIELQLAQRTREIRDETELMTQQQVDNVTSALTTGADAASQAVNTLGQNTIGVMNNVASSIISLGRSIADESLGLAIFEILLNKAIAISQIFAKAQTGEPISTGVKIGLLIAQLTTGFAQINAIVQQANEQRSTAPGFAKGGIMIGGDGSSTGDRLLVRISPRESIINAESSRKYTPELIAINNGTFDNFVNERYIQPALRQHGNPIVNVDGLFNDERLLSMQSKVNQAENKRHKELLNAISGGNRVVRGRKNWY